MGVLEHVIEFINEGACNKDFAEDNWIGKRGAKIIAWKQAFEATECT